MVAGSLDFTVECGATFSRVLTWKDKDGVAVNLTGYTARMQMRDTVYSNTSFVDITTENGGIALGGIAGTITLTVSAAATAAITATAGVYDLELVSSGGVVTRLLEGNVTISPNVTR